MVIKKKMRIIPDKLIFNGEVREMFGLHKSLWIRGFEVHLDENENITKVIVDGKHPNVDKESKVLCLSNEVIGKKFQKIGFPMLYSFISTYNLDRCYFRPWKKFRI